ncbi:ethanolamine utilization protein, partial [Pseudomonas sp. MWU13-2625]
TMTSITKELEATGRTLAELAEELMARLRSRRLLANNARIDYGLLKNEFRRHGLRFQTRALCTVKLSRRLYPQHFKHSLDSLIERHDIRLPERHRALADAEAVHRFLGIANQELGAAAVGAAMAAVLAAPPELAGLPAALQEQLELLPDVPGVYTLYGEDGKPLYVGKGS